MSKMREYLLQKDLWTLDLISSVLFATSMGAFVQYGADSGGIYVDRILFAMFLGFASYAGTFGFAFLLRNKIRFIRSWAWMGIGGALVHVIVQILVYLPKTWNYYQQFFPTTALRDVLAKEASSILPIWIVWAIPGCICIFTTRLVAYSFKLIATGRKTH
jgi:hypothetical protein